MSIALLLTAVVFGPIVYVVTPTALQKAEGLKASISKKRSEGIALEEEFISEWQYNYRNGIYDESIDYNHYVKISEQEVEKPI